MAKFTDEKSSEKEGAEDDVIITPRNPATLLNFGPASARDTVLYTAERPGGDPPLGADGIASRISNEVVQEWIRFVKAQGIQHVLVLLEDIELDVYEAPGLLKLYEAAGLTYHRTLMGETGASNKAMAIIRTVQASNEKILAHCTHGMGRSGRVAAGWLATQYGLSAEQATTEALAAAKERGVERMGSPKQLQAWLARSE